MRLFLVLLILAFGQALASWLYGKKADWCFLANTCRIPVEVRGEIRCDTPNAEFKIWLMEDDPGDYDDEIDDTHVTLNGLPWNSDETMKPRGPNTYWLYGWAWDSWSENYVEPYLKVEHDCKDGRYPSSPFCIDLGDTGSARKVAKDLHEFKTTSCSNF